ncbi:hypothetical protein FOZ63_008908, partial [Perkinsus olseni]
SCIVDSVFARGERSWDRPHLSLIVTSMASRSTGFASFCDTNGGDYPLFRSEHLIDFQPQAYTKDMKPFVAVRILLVIVAVAIFVVSGEADGKEEFNTHMLTDVIAKDHAQLNDKEGQESFMNPYSQTLAANLSGLGVGLLYAEDVAQAANVAQVAHIVDLLSLDDHKPIIVLFDHALIP